MRRAGRATAERALVVAFATWWGRSWLVVHGRTFVVAADLEDLRRLSRCYYPPR